MILFLLLINLAKSEMYLSIFSVTDGNLVGLFKDDASQENYSKKFGKEGAWNFTDLIEEKKQKQKEEELEKKKLARRVNLTSNPEKASELVDELVMENLKKLAEEAEYDADELIQDFKEHWANPKEVIQSNGLGLLDQKTSFYLPDYQSFPIKVEFEQTSFYEDADEKVRFLDFAHNFSLIHVEFPVEEDFNDIDLERDQKQIDIIYGIMDEDNEDLDSNQDSIKKETKKIKKLPQSQDQNFGKSVKPKLDPIKESNSELDSTDKLASEDNKDDSSSEDKFDFSDPSEDYSDSNRTTISVSTSKLKDRLKSHVSQNIVLDKSLIENEVSENAESSYESQSFDSEDFIDPQTKTVYSRENVQIFFNEDDKIISFDEETFVTRGTLIINKSPPNKIGIILAVSSKPHTLSESMFRDSAIGISMENLFGNSLLLNTNESDMQPLQKGKNVKHRKNHARASILDPKNLAKPEEITFELIQSKYDYSNLAMKKLLKNKSLDEREYDKELNYIVQHGKLDLDSISKDEDPKNQNEKQRDEKDSKSETVPQLNKAYKRCSTVKMGVVINHFTLSLLNGNNSGVPTELQRLEAEVLLHECNIMSILMNQVMVETREYLSFAESNDLQTRFAFEEGEELILGSMARQKSFFDPNVFYEL